MKHFSTKTKWVCRNMKMEGKRLDKLGKAQNFV